MFCCCAPHICKTEKNETFSICVYERLVFSLASFQTGESRCSLTNWKSLQMNFSAAPHCSHKTASLRNQPTFKSGSHQQIPQNTLIILSCHYIFFLPLQIQNVIKILYPFMTAGQVRSSYKLMAKCNITYAFEERSCRTPDGVQVCETNPDQLLQVSGLCRVAVKPSDIPEYKNPLSVFRCISGNYTKLYAEHAFICVWVFFCILAEVPEMLRVNLIIILLLFLRLAPFHK